MSTAELHREPFIHLVDLAGDRALIAWGGTRLRDQLQDPGKHRPWVPPLLMGPPPSRPPHTGPVNRPGFGEVLYRRMKHAEAVPSGAVG